MIEILPIMQLLYRNQNSTFCQAVNMFLLYGHLNMTACGDSLSRCWGASRGCCLVEMWTFLKFPLRQKHNDSLLLLLYCCTSISVLGANYV